MARTANRRTPSKRPTVTGKFVNTPEELRLLNDPDWFTPKERVQILAIALLAISIGCGSNPLPPSPNAVLKVTSTSNLTVSFDASGSTGSSLSYTLAYDDGKSDGPQSATTFSHTFQTAGTHAVTLSIHNAQGQSATATQSFSITPPSLSIRIAAIYDGPVALANCLTRFDIVGGGAFTDDAQFYSQYTWSMNFGDGNGTTTIPNHYAGDAEYEHTYGFVGTFVATVRVGDSYGQSASATLPVTVATITGKWSNTFHNSSLNRDETRILTLTQGANGVISGTYTHPEGNSESITGTISGNRDVEIHGSVSFSSSPPNSYTDTTYGVDGNVATMTLLAKGGSADGASLVFRKF